MATAEGEGGGLLREGWGYGGWMCAVVVEKSEDEMGLRQKRTNR